MKISSTIPHPHII